MALHHLAMGAYVQLRCTACQIAARLHALRIRNSGAQENRLFLHNVSIFDSPLWLLFVAARFFILVLMFGSSILALFRS